MDLLALAKTIADRVEISERKAYTSALVGMRTADLLPLVQPGQDLFPLMGLAGGRYCAMGGGAPLSRRGERVAGVGVSGGTVEQDVAILEAGLQDVMDDGRVLTG
jgi:uncharacterized protein GlcG (DUF336 family)